MTLTLMLAITEACVFVRPELFSLTVALDLTCFTDEAESMNMFCKLPFYE